MPVPDAMLSWLVGFLVPGNPFMGWDPTILDVSPGCLYFLKLFLNAGDEWGYYFKVL
jgi:hypothetical protein